MEMEINLCLSTGAVAYSDPALSVRRRCLFSSLPFTSMARARLLARNRSARTRTPERAPALALDPLSSDPEDAQRTAYPPRCAPDGKGYL